MRRLGGRRLVMAGAVLIIVAGTVLAAALSWWFPAVVGVVLLQLATLAVCWPRRGSSQRPVLTRIDELDQRVEAWGARMTAGNDRLRVEVLDALAKGPDASAGREDRPVAP